MADNNVVGGIFGVTPELLQQQRQAQQEAQARQVAQLTPQQLVTYYGTRGGQNLGNAASSLMGIEDPQMQMVRDVQSMKGQFDVSTPAGLRQFAQALSAKGYTDLAMQAANQAAVIGQKLGENINTLMGSGKYTPESLGKYAQTHNPADLVLVDKGLTGSALEKVASAEQNIQSLSSGNAEIDSWIKKVDPKNPAVTFGPLSTAGGAISSAAGFPSDNALEQAKLRRFISREANAILVAAKGTQTEGDAQRAYDMIMSGLDKNSNEGVLGALQDLKDMKSNTVKGLQTYVDTVKSKGKTLTAAPTQSSASVKAIADKIRQQNPGLTGYTDEQLVQLAQKQSKAK